MRLLFMLPALILLPVAVLPAADSPGGQIVYPRAEGGGYKLHLMNADGTGDRLLPGQTAIVNVLPAWSPDGKKITFMSSAALMSQQHQINLINADGTGLAALNTPSQRAGLAAWSRDGRQIAFTAGDERPNVYVCDAEGNGIRQLNSPDSGGAAPFWMPDGKTVGYTRFAGNEMKARIVLAKADGSGEEPLTTEDGFPAAGANALSPDGKRLAYVRLDRGMMKGTLNIWDFSSKADNLLLEVDGDLKGPESLALPAWAPDGKSLLVPLKTDKGTSLYKVSDDGQKKTRLTPEGVDCLAGAWFAKG